MYSQVLSFVLGFVTAIHSVTAQDPSITQIEIPSLGFIAAGDHFFGTIKWTEPRDILYYKVRFVVVDYSQWLFTILKVSRRQRRASSWCERLSNK